MSDTALYIVVSHDDIFVMFCFRFSLDVFVEKAQLKCPAPTHPAVASRLLSYPVILVRAPTSAALQTDAHEVIFKSGKSCLFRASPGTIDCVWTFSSTSGRLVAGKLQTQPLNLIFRRRILHSDEELTIIGSVCVDLVRLL